MKTRSPSARSHVGGTLIGFVIGVLVGLAGALAVAIYVTKVPMPFVDRGVSRKPAQDAAEAERNKGWNPNAVLGGKPAPVPGAGNEAGAIVVPPADGKPLPPASAPKAPASAADPIGDLLRSRPAADSAPAASTAVAPASGAPNPATADGFLYFVQAGAFRNPDEADAQRARLAMLGMAADISEREQSGQTVYRVRVGPFAQKAMADATREQLEANGVAAALVRVQR
jgi:cell division protein FtsN